MKKTLSLLSSLLILGSSITTTVSCNIKPNIYEKIYLVTDMGKVSDKSFNESGYNGGVDFVQKVISIKNKKYKNGAIGFIEPTSEREMKNAYGTAGKFGAKVIITPGFKQQNNISIAASATQGGNDIMIDGGSSTDAGVPEPNAIGVRYSRDIPGFLAGIASIIWYFQKFQSTKKVMKLSAYMGQENPTAVDSYLVGYFAAINIFNKLENDKTEKGNKFRETFDLKEGLKVTRVRSQMSAPAGNSDPNWFSNSFNIGDGKQISDNLISDGANVIFSVAGPQTSDTIASIRNHQKEGKVFVDGVDVDQVESYPKDSDLFITSATVNLIGSTFDVMGHTKYFGNMLKNNTDMYNSYKNQLPQYGVKENDLTFYETNGTTKKTADISPGSDWSGLNVWYGGDIGYSGENKITKDWHDKLINYFEGQDQLFYLNEVSEKFFSRILTKQSSENIDVLKTLSNQTLEDWVNIFMTGKGDFKF